MGERGRRDDHVHALRPPGRRLRHRAHVRVHGRVPRVRPELLVPALPLVRSDIRPFP